MLLEQLAYNIGLGLWAVHMAVFGTLTGLPDWSFAQMVALAKAFDAAIPVSDYAAMLAVYVGVAVPLSFYQGVKEARSWFPFHF